MSKQLYCLRKKNEECLSLQKLLLWSVFKAAVGFFLIPVARFYLISTNVSQEFTLLQRTFEWSPFFDTTRE